MAARETANRRSCAGLIEAIDIQDAVCIGAARQTGAAAPASLKPRRPRRLCAGQNRANRRSCAGLIEARHSYRSPLSSVSANRRSCAGLIEAISAFSLGDFPSWQTGAAAPASLKRAAVRRRQAAHGQGKPAQLRRPH